MSDSLGAWSNAPLAYVLAEVRTELLADLKDYQPKLAGRLRDEYPIQRAMYSARLVATNTDFKFEPEKDAAWEVATPDNRTAVILRANGLVLHATTYVDSREFLERLRRVLSVFSEEVPSVFINRLGLRYIDFILPGKNEQPEAYVDSRLNPDLGLSELDNGSMVTSVAVYPRKEGKLTLRYVRARGDPGMPPDLAGLSLDPSPLMKVGLVTKDQSSAVLDTDCIHVCSPVERLDPARVLERFAIMRKDASSAFKKAITDHARKIWGAN